MNSTAEVLRNTFQKYGDDVFLIDGRSGEEYSYRRVETLSLKFASYLKQKGLKKGDRLGFMLPNSIEIALFYFGALQTGVVAVPINPLLHPREMAMIVERAKLNALLISGDTQVRLKDKIDLPENIVVLDPASVNWDQYAELGSPSFAGIEDDDLAAIMFSSGTTGLPKGVRIQYGKAVANGRVFVETLGITPDMRFPGFLSAAYLGGWYNLLLIPFLAGASVVVTELFNASSCLTFWPFCKKFKISAIWFVPTIMAILLSIASKEENFDWLKKQVKLALVGTAPLSLELKNKFESLFGITVHENYALAETLFITTHAPKNKFKPRSVGQAIDGMSVEIVDPDEKSLPSGSVGEIAVKTSHGIDSYEGDPEQTASLIRNGRYFTGDLGELDEDGYLYIRGRKKDLIIRGGINISPREIEEVLTQHPAVQEASVVGMPHDVYGEEVVATVKINPGHEKTTVNDIIQFCRENLSDFKYPRKVFFIDEFPKNYAGKIQKEKLKALLKSKLVSLLG